jgi:hypothetical protein
MPHREGSGSCPTPTTIHQPAPHTALRRLVARQPVAALLMMVYTVNTAVSKYCCRAGAGSDAARHLAVRSGPT